MAVCIAAACENGEHIVTATDSLLSAGDVVGEAVAGKMLWYGDWQFMYAGTPAYFSLMMEEIEAVGMNDREALSRLRIQETIRSAYRKTRCRLSSCEALDPFGITVEQFKEDGLSYFGENFHQELLRIIQNQSTTIGDQVLVTGWGKSPHSVMVYEIGPWGDALHTASGFAAIGSGAQMAQNMLLLLAQARHRTLAETIFNVACAKFFSEKSSGLDVGQQTTIYVARKRQDGHSGQLAGEFVSFDEIDTLRALWEKHLRPRIPNEIRGDINRIAARTNKGKMSSADSARELMAKIQIINENADLRPLDACDRAVSDNGDA